MFKFLKTFVLILFIGLLGAQAQIQPTTRSLTGIDVAKAAESIIDPMIIYDPSYVKMDYPNGDVDPKTGVCTDVVIRAYRKLKVDLQKLIHEDMKSAWNTYPNNWGLKGTDKNIDHRRVPNLMNFFTRHGISLAISKKPSSYKEGDIVVWDLGGGILHIGVISSMNNAKGNRRQVIHNIGNGQIAEDVLFNWKIIGHYRFLLPCSD